MAAMPDSQLRSVSGARAWSARMRSGAPGRQAAGTQPGRGDRGVMGVITESDGAAGEYEEVEIPAAPDIDGGPAGSVLRRKSPRPSRRAVLYVHSSRGSGVPSDLARWFTERG